MTCKCDVYEGTHEEWCEESTVTRLEVLDLMRTVGSVIDDYLFWDKEDLGMSQEDCKQAAVEQVVESLICYWGMYSCRGGGCKH